MGQYDQALTNYQQALVIAREVGDRVGKGNTLYSIGSMYHDREQYGQALEYYQQALVIAREVGDRGLEETVRANIENSSEN
jgi:tetratricopeptide (TPR) repeat protein